MRYIDVDGVISTIEEVWQRKYVKCGYPPLGDVYRMIMKRLKSAPTADVVEVRHGRWTLHKDGSGTCSECGTTQKNVWDCDSWQNYCGHCGAKMDGEQKEGDI